MRAGDTFIRRGKHVDTDPHLWIVISDPEKDRSHLVCVNITSQRIDKDQSCVILPDEHPFVTQESVIQYRGARVVPESGIRSAVEARVLKYHSPVTAALLERIRNGAITPHLPLGARRLLQLQGVIPTDD